MSDELRKARRELEDHDEMELTDAEEKAIKALKRVAKTWPKSLWLFATGSSLHVMRKTKQGKGVKAALKNECIDPKYRVAGINIENDGGDW